MTNQSQTTNLLERVFHEQYSCEGDLVIFQCRECGYASLSPGSTHAHIEGHRGYTRFNIQIPFTKTAMANVDQLMKRTDVLRVTNTEQIELSEVECL